MIMNYEGILEFKGTWRRYQARVLEHADRYMADGKIHIVAAPGSGKTTLGIELIRRMNGKALILAPSITIREQWIARIEEAFLCEGIQGEDYLSQNLKQPKAITVATYQALHSAMTRFQGIQEDAGEDSGTGTDECPAKTETKEVDYSGFDLVGTMKEAGIEVLCLDECHHLRSEWWKALEEFKKQVNNLKIIALTATPPYDSTPAMWTRYMNMCGEIDEEITIPELVKEGSLCPHQDYVYFNYPTKEEEKEVRRFEERSKAMTEKIMRDTQFLTYVRSHKGFSGQLSDDLLLDNPAYLASLLIYLQSKNIAIPSRLQRLLGAKKLPDMNVQWMERLLQGFLYDDVDSYLCDKTYRELLIADLKSDGLIEKKKVVMTKSAAVEKMLTNSLGKCNSIRDIVFHEYEASGQDLRLLVLTDYIRKEYEKAIGNTEYDVNSLGVLPFFEMLRRDNEKKNEQIRFGVLCGTIVIIPAEAREALEQAIGMSGKVTFSRIGNLSETDYLKVTAVGNAHFLTGAVTDIFSKGYMQVLIGTKTLLGEGWDSPCINSLILASFVKAFGNGIRKALEEQQLLEETHCKVETESNGPDNHIIYLSGGSGRDKALFAQCVNEFFDVIDNQRYILVKKKGHKGLNGFYAIPNCFSKKKEDAERFAKCMHPYIGNYDCVYTRNEKGRELLLEGRVKALANREERCISHKKVKGALE